MQNIILLLRLCVVCFEQVIVAAKLSKQQTDTAA